MDRFFQIFVSAVIGFAIALIFFLAVASQVNAVEKKTSYPETEQYIRHKYYFTIAEVEKALSEYIVNHDLGLPADEKNMDFEILYPCSSYLIFDGYKDETCIKFNHWEPVKVYIEE